METNKIRHVRLTVASFLAQRRRLFINQFWFGTIWILDK